STQSENRLPRIALLPGDAGGVSCEFFDPNQPYVYFFSNIEDVVNYYTFLASEASVLRDVVELKRPS
ncbi:MAG: hypothetical protein KDI79_14540, partial [Anaerolineae bacterium]|nr:hypothetical protein [Anaerolineae bacterium]